MIDEKKALELMRKKPFITTEEIANVLEINRSAVMGRAATI